MAGKRDEVTIAEVAEALNISKTTVSRAISGKGRVSEATRARVFDYIGKGRQDAAAPLRTAQQGPTNNLALVIPKHFMRLDLPFLRKCMGGVWNMAAQRGYDLLLCYAGETDVGQLERQLESHKVDGVILSRTMLHDECVQTLQRHNVPFVAIGRVDDDKVPQVDNDQVGATAEMTRLLLGLISNSPIRIPSGGVRGGNSVSPAALNSRELISPRSISWIPERSSTAQTLTGGSFVSFSSSHAAREESMGTNPMFFFMLDSSFQISSRYFF